MVIGMKWKCVDCGYESEDRWLMCPECTTPEDWAEVRRLADDIYSKARREGRSGRLEEREFPEPTPPRAKRTWPAWASGVHIGEDGAERPVP